MTNMNRGNIPAFLLMGVVDKAELLATLDPFLT